MGRNPTSNMEAAVASLWLTYAWANREDGSFQFVVEELQEHGVAVRYDRVQIVAGQRLWEQIGHKITTGELSGWAYLVTRSSLESNACREELAYALDRALRSKGRAFPVIGLVDAAVQMGELPPPLRARLCVSLASPSWADEVEAALEGRSPKEQLTRQHQYHWDIVVGRNDRDTRTVIEVRPWSGVIMDWRFIIPASSELIAWGYGPAGTRGERLQAARNGTFHSSGVQSEGLKVHYFGAGEQLTPGVSAYAVLHGPPPVWVEFGQPAGRHDPDLLPQTVERASPSNA